MTLGLKTKEALENLGVSFRPNSRSWVMSCPRCGKKDKVYVRKTDGQFICWVCRETSGFTGKPEFLLAELSGRPVGQIRQELYGSNSPTACTLEVTIHDFFGETDDIPVFIPPELPTAEPSPDFRALDSPYGADGADYLRGRGIPLDVALEYGIQYWPSKRSVVFPVLLRGRLLGWQTRYIYNTELLDENDKIIQVPKARTSDGLKKDRTFMFSDRITSDYAVLAEGPVDSLKCHLAGGNICSLGKSVSQTQVEILKNSGISRLYLALDPDAYIESGKLLRELSSCMSVYDMRPPGGYKDLGEMSMRDVRTLFEHAPLLNPRHIFVFLKDDYGTRF